jgi:hypothetical protein
VYNVSFIDCVALCAVFYLSVVCYFVRYVYFCVSCLIVVPLPRGKNQFAVQLNNNINNNNNNNKLLNTRTNLYETWYVCQMIYLKGVLHKSLPSIRVSPVVARQRLGKKSIAATNTQTKIGLWDASCSTR